MQPAVRTLYGLVVRCDPGSEADPTAMKHDRSVKIRSTKLRPAGSSDGETEDNAPVNGDAILQSILGRGGERFGMAAAVLRGERIIARGAAGIPSVFDGIAL